MFFFFFSSRRRHTRWTGDWSSDVCSSDLVSFKRLLDGAGTLPHLHEIQFTIATHREPAQESGYVFRGAGDVIDKHRGAPGHLRRIAVGERQILVVAHDVSKDSRVKTVALDSVIAYADSGGRRARTHGEVSTIPVS